MKNTNDYKEIFKNFLKEKETERQTMARLEKKLKAGSANMDDLEELFNYHFCSTGNLNDIANEAKRLLAKVSAKNIPQWFVEMADKDGKISFIRVLIAKEFEAKVAEVFSQINTKK